MVPMEFDYTGLTADINKSIEATLEEGPLEPFECGVDIKGISQCDDENVCANTGYDEMNRIYCRANNLRKLTLQREEFKWLPSMLEFYWQRGIAEEGWKFLRITGFVTSYEYVT